MKKQDKEVDEMKCNCVEMMEIPPKACSSTSGESDIPETKKTKKIFTGNLIEILGISFKFN